MMLSAIVLISILMLAKGALNIALSRLNTSESANFQAFHDATAANPPQYANNTGQGLADGFATLRPGLPLRLHSPRPTEELTIHTGDKQPLPPVTIGAEAAVPGPPWIYCGYPYGSNDHGVHAHWFGQYVEESHGPVIQGLGLAPYWAP